MHTAFNLQYDEAFHTPKAAGDSLTDVLWSRSGFYYIAISFLAI